MEGVQYSINEIIGKGYGTFWNFESGKITLIGGKGSKKSKTTALKWMYMLKKHPEACLLVTRKVKDNIRESCYNDLKWAAEKLHLDYEWKFNIHPLQATNLLTGQKIFLGD